jgi:hypothetical protein
LGQALADDLILSLVNVQDDKGNPVVSEIWQIPAVAPDQAFSLGETDRDGTIEPGFPCSVGIRIQARPNDETFSYSKRVHCRSQLSLRVDPIDVVMRLQDNLEKAVTAEDFASASIIATELASTESPAGGVTGLAAASLAIVYAERAFDVTDGTVYDPQQGMEVMTPELKGKILSFQRNNNLKETGNLDYNTLSTLSGTTSGAVRYQVYGAGQM